MHEVHFYRTARGDSPVQEFFNSQDSQTRAKITLFLDFLKEYGPRLKRPYADKLDGKIYELRPKQSWILYFFHVDRKIILLHGFLKKSNAVKHRDLDIARRRMAEWVKRYQ